MKLYWTVESIPELAPLAPPDRTRIWQACGPRSFTHWQTWMGIVLMLIGCYAPAWVLLKLLVWNGVNDSVATVVTLPIVAVSYLVGIVLLRQIIIAQTRPYIRAYIAHQYGVSQQGDRPHPATDRDDPQGRRS